MTAETPEMMSFQAEVTQLLDLMVHSLYSNKEIFLRELISNASDAIDRLRFVALSDPTLLDGDGEYAIHVSYDKAARTITVADNGIGMTRDEVVEHIGTIARSGTREFLRSLTGDQQKDAHLIGQFGVGFYSAFVVAERVTLVTRKAGQPADGAVVWESDGRATYTLASTSKPERGTAVTLHLRADEDELLDGYRLRGIIRKYSDHISVPILMPKEGDKAEGTEQVNRAAALWTRPKGDITDDEYAEFYKHIAPDYEAPLAWVHSRMEGTQEYILLLFIPKHAPFDLWTREQPHGVKLYVRRVFIMDDAEQLLPRYLRFVRGVVDSSDLPLNVSREILQHNRVTDQIKAQAVKKLLAELADIAANKPDDYAIFWKEFGRVLKEGIFEDPSNRESLMKLLRFASTSSGTGPSGQGEQSVALDTYVSRMPEGQDAIYYLIAENYEAAKDSPLLEVFRQKNIEVLILTDPVDAVIETDLPAFEGKRWQSVARGEVDVSKVPDQEQQPQQEAEAMVDDVDALLKRLQTVLAEQVKAVRVSARLATSPACLVNDEHDLDPTLKRLLQASGKDVPRGKPILEINPHHALIARISREADAQRFSDWALFLYEQSLLSRGDHLDNPARFVSRMNALLIDAGEAARG